jgi:hypothetical protein
LLTQEFFAVKINTIQLFFVTSSEEPRQTVLFLGDLADCSKPLDRPATHRDPQIQVFFTLGFLAVPPLDALSQSGEIRETCLWHPSPELRLG